MNEQELPNLRGVGDRLVVDVASHVLDEIFCLVVPTNGPNYCLSDSQSLRIVEALTQHKKLQNKQGTGGSVTAGSPMLKLDREIESIRISVLQAYISSHTFLLPLLPYM